MNNGSFRSVRDQCVTSRIPLRALINAASCDFVWSVRDLVASRSPQHMQPKREAAASTSEPLKQFAAASSRGSEP